MLFNLNNVGNEIKNVNKKLQDLEVNLVESQNRIEQIKSLETKVATIEKEKSNLKMEGIKLFEKVNDTEEEYSNKLEDIEHKLESVIVALNTLQNSSPIARTIKTGKRKLTEGNDKKTEDNQEIYKSAPTGETQNPEVKFTHVTILKQPHVIDDAALNAIEENSWKECPLCGKTFKSEVTSKNHDKKLHMTPGPGKDRSYKCNYCSTNNLKRQELYNHILESHKKCTICDKVCPTQSSFESHMKAIHLKPSSKHTLEREPSLKNYKNKKFD